MNLILSHTSPDIVSLNFFKFRFRMDCFSLALDLTHPWLNINSTAFIFIIGVEIDMFIFLINLEDFTLDLQVVWESNLVV
eukprot:CAMPEP_0170544100 /NCGR_PEP_ID=MMETSP0211-20121228/2986_1 /TAXON_ID=311385 /ORGANISM="Pseudokeronopsis sp., Strain OXSARD2" /LENGTH=79 /DNA_ID=CAMNT_0010847659 /DNA_START=126 /DNA_END=365 /DNA_ORIENTATION=+